MRIAAGSERRGGCCAARFTSPNIHARIESLEPRLLRYHEPPPQLDSSDPGSVSWVQDIAQTADGRDLILMDDDAVTGQFGLARYVLGPDGSNGALDTTFGGGTGAVVINQTSGPIPGDPGVLAVLPDGRIVTAGIIQGWDAVLNKGRTYVTLTRHLADGSLDPTFGTGGVRHAPATDTAYLTDVLAAPDGKLLVVGGMKTDDDDAPWIAYVRRFNADGSADASFGIGGDGVVTADFAAGWMDEFAAAHVDAQGRVVAIGTTSQQGSNLALLRLTDAGTPDPTFGPDGQLVGNATRGRANINGWAAVGFNYRDRTADLARVYTAEAAPLMIEGYLFVAGTQDSDTIHIARVDASTLIISLNGVAHTVTGVVLHRHVVVDALGGDDVITIEPDVGCAYVWGGDGNDRIGGSDRVDVLSGGAGNDSIDGHGGNDSLYGGSGADVLVGHVGYDWLVGGYGADRLAAGNSTDFVYGGYGNDVIGGGNGSDYLYGGAGDDTLNGNGGGDDLLEGNEGTNFYAYPTTYRPSVLAIEPAGTASAFASLEPGDDRDELTSL